MLFTSNVFVFYFLPAILILYYVCSFSRMAQNMVLLAGSLLFYAWGEPVFVFLMLASILLNTLFGSLIDRFRGREGLAKMLLLLACTVNVGSLFYFKYLNFILVNIRAVTGWDLEYPEIPLPIGISFFTFQALSYVIDVYWGTAEVQKNPFYVGLYISFFPQLIAGPIVRYNNIAKQIIYRKSTWRKFSVGCCRFVTGFGKKILLANTCAVVADRIFGMTPYGTVPVSLAWLGIIAFMFQLFFDFSAYSDMAIGLALMFGFKLEENFDYPLISKSINEFWRRWHISLSTWFREYVYFPLGGSRVENNDIMVRNLFVVWLLTGVWHGAEWTFVLWGLFNFIFILLERLAGFEKSNIPNLAKHLYTLFVLNLGFVLFRSENLQIALLYFKNLFGFSGSGVYSQTALMFLREYGIFLAAAVIFSIPAAPRVNRLLADRKLPVMGICLECIYPAVMCLLFAVSVMYMVKGSYNPFIYFNF